MSSLYLIPTPLSWTASQEPWLDGVLKVLSTLRDFVVENLPQARRFLRQAGFLVSFDELHFKVLNVHTHKQELKNFLQPIFEGRDLALFSEAGCPAVADPGSDLVREAHRNRIRVIPLIGPSSVVLALMASGLNGQRFYFQGYLAKERPARQKQIRELEQQLFRTAATQIIIETPHRNTHLLQDLLEQLSLTTRLCLAMDLTGASELIMTRTVQEWREQVPVLEKLPTIFLVGI